MIYLREESEARAYVAGPNAGQTRSRRLEFP